MVSISRKGLAFLTDSPPKANRVTLFLSFAENEAPLCLEGKIVYSLPRGTGLAYRVGVAFSPFSARKGHNSLVSLGVLDYLEKIHGAGNA